MSAALDYEVVLLREECTRIFNIVTSALQDFHRTGKVQRVKAFMKGEEDVDGIILIAYFVDCTHLDYFGKL